MSDNIPPSQMLRVPSALVDAVKELSRLHRSGYTSAVLTGLQQLIASIDSTADSVSSVAAGRSDTQLLAELIAGLDERIATQVAVQVTLLEQRMATQFGEQIREGFSMACEVGKELGRELERVKQQSPLPTESAPPVASSTPAAKGKVPRVAPKSQGNKSGRKEPGVVLARVEENLIRGQKLTADELAEIIGVTAQGIRARRDAEEKGNVENLAEWGLRFIPNSKPQQYERI